MTEGLATPDGRPTAELEHLYGQWADSGAGLLLSGNIMIDKDHLERPGNVVIDREPDADMAERLERWAAAGTRNGTEFWAQLNHAGRQTQKAVNAHPKSASGITLNPAGGQFGTPSPLTIEQIADLVNRWAMAAKACKDAGFTGVQIHAAHGYLISQFLSPLANVRTDKYGRGIEKRSRFLLEVVGAVRVAVGESFPISVKLNSADFQKGGFAFEDSLTVVQKLEKATVDLIEISGGTYEQPKLLGIEGIEPESTQPVAESTAAREAYFVDFANAMQEHVSVPLMVTGGFRTRAAMHEAIETGAADVIGLARPMCVLTDAPKRLLDGLDELPRHEEQLGLIPERLAFLKTAKLIRTLDGFAIIYWFYEQIWRLGHGRRADENLSVLKAYRMVDSRSRELLKKRSQP